jgi:hypothetical protein
MAEAIPEEVKDVLDPLMQQIRDLTALIRGYDKAVEARAANEPAVNFVDQVKGVGSLTALTFVLTVEDPHRFPHSRKIGSYLGLRPRLDESGAIQKQLRITKAGDKYLRSLLVGSAQYILGPFGPDTDLRRWGLKLAERGGKNAKKRAVVAVARKLAVLMLTLWKTGAKYEPLRQAKRQESTAFGLGAIEADASPKRPENNLVRERKGGARTVDQQTAITPVRTTGSRETLLAATTRARADKLSAGYQKTKRCSLTRSVTVAPRRRTKT